ncbi:class I mannose-6-phosphate isomerase [Mobilicoccus caccae]|uniref:Mannose-6-phosphate isomerase n=1 Tax=Mobilicoccus caccae TaxID=1859295 RepID=A0ABQ6IKF0_9MICO|nr:class I mannose-6-phosphate isomerase [Mobilicoccus caccae]GMA38380.1 mannose-6-phosphate isomerase [Mobilicoccus caccae]
MIHPVKLSPNQPADRFYRGGPRISEFRSGGAHGSHVPEDWVASVTTLHGEESLGLSRLPTGELLRDQVRRHPEAWLGRAHVEAWGADTKLLTKLLDAGQRLPVHVHPDADFASRHLGVAHGKTEAWVFLRGGTVHLGWRFDIDEVELRRWVDDQDVDAMLAAMYAIEVSEGDAVLVPAGTPHAIGEGCFIVEVQEPEDLSILLEWVGFDIDGPSEGHLGIGFDTALRAVDLRGTSGEDLTTALVRRRAAADGAVLPPAANQFFRADRVSRGAHLPPGFGIVVVTGGTGEMRWSEGAMALVRGDTVVLPADAGEVEFGGEVSAIVCRPPVA